MSLTTSSTDPANRPDGPHRAPGGRRRRWVGALLGVGCLVFAAAARQPTAPLGLDAAAAVDASNVSANAVAAPPGEPLRTLAIRRGELRFGTAVTAGGLANEPAYRDTVNSQFNSLTPEFQMGWKHVEQTEGQRVWTDADAIMLSASQNNQRVRAGLMWHKGLPQWLEKGVARGDIGREEFRALVRNHITSTMTRYRDRVQSWDVINEPLNDDGTPRNSILRQQLGDDYIAELLRWARAADPDARLYINDYSTERTNSKSTALYNLVRTLRGRGVPVDGVGFQSHITLTTDLASVQSNLQRFANLGVDVAVTELDVRIPTPADATELEAQARQYDRMVQACLAVTRCTSVTVWGPNDSHSWVPGSFAGMGAATLLDAGFQAKPAYTRVQATLTRRDLDTNAVALHSQQCLDAPRTDTNLVHQWTCNGANTNQQFTLRRVASDVYMVRNRGTGRCLEVRGASTANGAPVVQAACNAAAANQQFRLQRVTGLGTSQDFQLRPRHANGTAMCLDITGNATGNGARIQQYSCHTTTAPTQRNQVVRLSGPTGHL